MPKVSPAMDTCPLARSIGVIGDWWTLLILRNALLAGQRRFDQFHRNLGIATNILTRRLDDLVEAGILERVPSDHPRSKYEYQVTDKGLELWPVFSALLDWGNRWTADGQAPPRRLLHEHCGGAVQTATHCSACADPLHPGDIFLEPAGSASPVPSRARTSKPGPKPRKNAPGEARSGTGERGPAARTSRTRTTAAGN